MIVAEHLAFFGEEAVDGMELVKGRYWQRNIKEFLIFFPEMEEIWFYTIKDQATEGGCLYMHLWGLRGMYRAWRNQHDIN